MEINGVANIKILVDQLEEESSHNMEVMPEAINPILDGIKEQLLLLERYMLAYADHNASVRAEHDSPVVFTVEEPLWHEIRENPSKYPNGRERIEGFKKQMNGG